MRRPPLVGLPVVSVEPGSPCGRAGLLPGDLVRGVDGEIIDAKTLVGLLWYLRYREHA